MVSRVASQLSAEAKRRVAQRFRAEADFLAPISADERAAAENASYTVKIANLLLEARQGEGAAARAAAGLVVCAEVLLCDADVGFVDRTAVVQIMRDAAEEVENYYPRELRAARKFNIEKDTINGERYELAVSFEVAEHLPSWMANRFVFTLCGLSPLIVMSAAIPGQGGTDHINEQPHSYWIKKFSDNGFDFDMQRSEKLRSGWKSAGIAVWYYQNAMVFFSRGDDRA